MPSMKGTPSTAKKNRKTDHHENWESCAPRASETKRGPQTCELTRGRLGLMSQQVNMKQAGNASVIYALECEAHTGAASTGHWPQIAARATSFLQIRRRSPPISSAAPRRTATLVKVLAPRKAVDSRLRYAIGAGAASWCQVHAFETKCLLSDCSSLGCG